MILVLSLAKGKGVLAFQRGQDENTQTVLEPVLLVGIIIIRVLKAKKKVISMHRDAFLIYRWKTSTTRSPNDVSP